MATPTYDLLDSVTLSSSSSSVTFSSIDQSYRDLVLVVEAKAVSNSNVRLRINNDTTNFSPLVYMEGTGSAEFSSTSDNDTRVNVFTGVRATPTTALLGIAQIMDYSVTDKHTAILSRASSAIEGVVAAAVRYGSTSAVTSIQFLTDADFSSGSTFYLYGVAA